MHDITNTPFSVTFHHRVTAADDIFDEASSSLADAIGETDPADQPPRVLAFLDAGVHTAQPTLADTIATKLATRPASVIPAGPVHITPGGEAIKNGDAWRRAVAAIDHARLCRRSIVLIIGGGAVLDAIGFAAATTHRGVRVIRVPSTTLAQSDAAIGVKNGINAEGKKNLIGTFAPPHAVLLDHTLLRTLTPEAHRAGFSEAVKVALLKDADFFTELEHTAAAIAARDDNACRAAIHRSAELHADHIAKAGDPFELSTARPLDLGHWSAHKLEQLSNFTISHGDAVATGLAIDAHYAAIAGLADQDLVDRTTQVLERLGFPLTSRTLQSTDPDHLLQGLEEFREHLGGRLTITLVAEPGRPANVHAIDQHAMREAISRIAALEPSTDAASRHRAIRHRRPTRQEPARD